MLNLHRLKKKPKNSFSKKNSLALAFSHKGNVHIDLAAFDFQSEYQRTVSVCSYLWFLKKQQTILLCS